MCEDHALKFRQKRERQQEVTDCELVSPAHRGTAAGLRVRS